MADDKDEFMAELNRTIAEGLAQHSRTRDRVYHCKHCKETWDSGRDARQHGIKEHGNLDGYYWTEE